MQDKIWLSSPHMGGGEQQFVKEAFDANWVAPLGPNVNGFEADLKSSVLNVDGVLRIDNISIELDREKRKGTINIEYTDVYNNQNTVNANVKNY